MNLLDCKVMMVQQSLHYHRKQHHDRNYDTMTDRNAGRMVRGLQDGGTQESNEVFIAAAIFRNFAVEPQTKNTTVTFSHDAKDGSAKHGSNLLYRSKLD